MAEPLFTTVEHAAAWRKEYIDVLEAVLVKVRQELADCTRDGQRLSQLLADEEQRAEALEAALHALVEREPVVHNNLGVYICGVCQAREGMRHGWMPPVPFPHAPDCAWVTARALEV